MELASTDDSWPKPLILIDKIPEDEVARLRLPAELVHEIICYFVAEFLDRHLSAGWDHFAHHRELIDRDTLHNIQADIIPVFLVSRLFRDTLRNIFSRMLCIPVNDDGR